jgi:hypothetical protein
MATLDSFPVSLNPLLRLGYRPLRRMNDLVRIMLHSEDRMRQQAKRKVRILQSLGPFRQLHRVFRKVG